MPDSTSTLRVFHEGALSLLHGLLRLHDLVLEYYRLADQKRTEISAEALYQEHILPFAKAHADLAGNPEMSAAIERMIAARLALGRDVLKFVNTPAASAHELAFGASIYFWRLWNRHCRPGAGEIAPLPSSNAWNIPLCAPSPGMEAGSFMDDAYRTFQNFNPLLLHAELKLEFVKATAMLQADQPAPAYRIRRNGKTWHLQYQHESYEDSVQGNQCIGWLAKLLAVPNRLLAVADLRVDPDRKIAADATLGADAEIDREGIAAIRQRLEDIEESAPKTGLTEAQEHEKEELLNQLKGPKGKMLGSQLRRAHANIATQLRNLMKKLKEVMPQFAGHLRASLNLDFPDFGYYPPNPPPAWHF
jgi:hypothetical protein